MKHISKTLCAIGALSITPMTALADQVFLDDLIVDGSACIGFDCVNGESFGSDTLRLKENNLRIHFDDTSNSASFPNVDWRLEANDTSNGGANRFSIVNATNSRTPFTVRSGAASNALYIDDQGDIGIATSSPVLEMHIVDGDSPAIRLEQDGSSGFTPQTFDIAANETNFFVRDVTNGSQLPFRIQPGADTNALYIADDNNIGMGTATPSHDLEISKSDNAQIQLTSTNAGAVQLRLTSTNAGNRRIVGLLPAGDTASEINFGEDRIGFFGTSGNNLATLDSTGLSVGGTQLNVPDYVFDEDYDLRSLSKVAEFIDENGHLPDVPSAAMIAKGGLNMTEMQLTLLRKIEELTLYALAQETKISRLEQALSSK